MPHGEVKGDLGGGGCWLKIEKAMFNVGGGKYFIKKQLMWMDSLRTYKPTLCKTLSIDICHASAD